MPFVTFCRNTTRRRSRWRSPGGLARGSNFIFRAKSHLDPTRFSSRLRNPLFPLLFSFFSTLRPFFLSFIRSFVRFGAAKRWWPRRFIYFNAPRVVECGETVITVLIKRKSYHSIHT